MIAFQPTVGLLVSDRTVAHELPAGAKKKIGPPKQADFKTGRTNFN
jgi:hypothetical protein